MKYLTPPPDKSISIRLALFSLLCLSLEECGSYGVVLSKAHSAKYCEVQNFLDSEDARAAIFALEALGLEVKKSKIGSSRLSLKIYLTPRLKSILTKQGLDKNLDIYMYNSGTSTRLLAALLSALGLEVSFSGDASLSARPMGRLDSVLQAFGTGLAFQNLKQTLPFSTMPHGKLHVASFASPTASAQIKSAFILMALFANSAKQVEEETHSKTLSKVESKIHSTKSSFYTEPSLSRDHTENILKYLGADITSSPSALEIAPLKAPLAPYSLSAPNDPSSGYFFAICALIFGFNLTLKGVLLNATRIGGFRALEIMGADIKYKETCKTFEAIGDIIVYGSQTSGLKPLGISKEGFNIASLIDELPALALLCAFVGGQSSFKDIAELRVKECDRIVAIKENLQLLGVKTTSTEDSLEIYGDANLLAKIDSTRLVKSKVFKTFDDHRIAMMMLILSYKFVIKVDNEDCVGISYPEFIKDMEALATQLNK